MTSRGADPKFADTPFARWIKRRLTDLGWQKKDLVAEVLRLEGGTRLGHAGADAAVRRATHGKNVTDANKDLIVEALGGGYDEPQGQIDEDDLTRRVVELERLVRGLLGGSS